VPFLLSNGTPASDSRADPEIAATSEVTVMDVSRVSRRTVVGCLVSLLWLGPAPASALTLAELTCQETIGTASLRFAKRVHLAELHCENATASGRTCDTAGRDAVIGDAAHKLGDRLATRCADVQLEQLGFPGTCTDANGAPFTEPELAVCMRDSHQSGVVTAVGVEYPPRPAALDGDPLQCQRKIGNAAARFLKQKLKYRQRCRDGQLRGSVGASVNCRNEIPPGGPGTGDAITDERIAGAMAKLDDQVGNACQGVTLEDLGFPGSCADADGPPFSVADLQRCLEDTHEQIADAMFAVEYP
jgi:hypothetical protein